MAEKPEDLNLPTAVVTRLIKEVVSSRHCLLLLFNKRRSFSLDTNWHFRYYFPSSETKK